KSSDARGSLIRSMVWLKTKPAVAASRIAATPCTAASSARVLAVMGILLAGDRWLLWRLGRHGGVAREEAVAFVVRRQAAGVAAAEPAVPVARQRTVEAVAQPPRQQPQRARRMPWPAQMHEHGDDRIAVGARTGGIEQQERHRVVRVEAVRGEQSSPGGVLHRGEAEPPRA